jgi:hypothetical protein
MAQRLAQHLMARGLVPARIVDEALKRAEKAQVGLDTALLSLDAISEAGVLQAISDVSNIRLVNLADFEPNSEAGPMMPYKMSKQLGVVPLSLDGQTLHIACAYPVPTAQLKDVGFLLGRKLELFGRKLSGLGRKLSGFDLAVGQGLGHGAQERNGINGRGIDYGSAQRNT